MHNDRESKTQTGEACSSQTAPPRNDVAGPASEAAVHPLHASVGSAHASSKAGSVVVDIRAPDSGPRRMSARRMSAGRSLGKAHASLKAINALTSSRGTGQVEKASRRDSLPKGKDAVLLDEDEEQRRGSNSPSNPRKSSERGSVKKARRSRKKASSVSVKEEEEDPEEVLARLRRKILDEEHSLRTSEEVTQLELIFSDIFNADSDMLLALPIRVLPCERPRPLLQYFHSCVKRVIEANRTWCLQLKVQRLVSGVMLDFVSPGEKKMRSRQAILRSVQEGQNYWENIAAADRCTSMLLIPTPQACGNFDRQGSDGNSEVVAPPRQPPPSPLPPPYSRMYSTLSQYSPRLWPSDIRTAGGLRSCPGTKDGVPHAEEFQSYLDLLLFEQDRQSASHHGGGTLGCSAGFLKSRPSKRSPSLDAVSEDVAAEPPSADGLGSSSSSFMVEHRLSHRRTSLRSGGSRGLESAHIRDLESGQTWRGSLKDDGRHRRVSSRDSTKRSGLEIPPPLLHESSAVPASGSASEYLPAIKDGSSRGTLGRRSAIYKNVLQELTGARPNVASVARTCRGLSDASFGAHAPLFNPLPRLVRLDGCPFRRRGQARILSEVRTDRILTEFEGDPTMPEDNEIRPEVQYFRSCNERSIMPSKLDFLSEDHPEQIMLSNQRLTDEHVQALGYAFTNKAPDLRVLDLSGNRLLTDASLQPTLERLYLSKSLMVLRLGGTQLGSGTLTVLAQAMVTKFQLEELSLQSVPVADSMWHVLCRSIVKAATLTKLDLSDTQCGRWQQTPCIQLSQMLMELPQLKVVDLSNNYFRVQGLYALGRAVGHPRFKLEELSLNDNASPGTEAMVEGVFHPMVAFCEQIRYNKTLLCLELQRSQVGLMAAYSLEESILSHPQINKLRVDGNPFGEYGLRSFLRCLLTKTSQLEVITISEFRDINVKPCVLFNYGDLTENYVESQTLDLSTPYHRAVLRLILRRTEDFKQPPMACLQKLKIDGQRVEQCPFTKDSAGLWSVPTSGMVEFHLLLTIPPDTTDSAEDFLLKWQTARRLPISVSKFKFLHRTWITLENDRERRLFIECVAKECILKLAHLRIFADEVKRSMPNLLSAVVSGLALAMPFIHRACINSALLPYHGAVINPRTSRKERKSSRQEEKTESPEMSLPRKQVLSSLSKLMLFNSNNPNGHYDLDLSNPTEYTVAERILLVATWEARVASSQGCWDLSETGDYNAIRNFTVNGEPECHTLDWQLPGDGYMAEDVIKFDYVSLRRPKATDPIVSERGFAQLSFFLKGFNSGKDMDLTESSVFFSILKATHNEVLSAEQLAEIISFTKVPERRRDLFCVLFTRCRDVGSPISDLYHGVIGYQPGMIPGLFTLEDRLLIRERIGYVNTLDWVHIHEAPLNRLSLNLAMQDARRIAKCILELADIEPGVNMVETSWTGFRSKQLTVWSPPGTWNDNLPEHGIFEVSYVVENPHYIREQARRRLAGSLSWPQMEDDQDVGSGEEQINPSSEQASASTDANIEVHS